MSLAWANSVPACYSLFYRLLFKFSALSLPSLQKFLLLVTFYKEFWHLRYEKGGELSVRDKDKKVLWKIINPILTGVFIAGIFQGGWGSMDPHIYFMVNIMQHMLTHLKSLLHLKYFTGVSTRNRMISEQAPVYWWKSKKRWSESRFSEELRNRVSKKNFIKSRMIWHFNTEIFHFGFFPLWFVTKMWKVSSETKSTFYSAKKGPKSAKYTAKKVEKFSIFLGRIVCFLALGVVLGPMLPCIS